MYNIPNFHAYDKAWFSSKEDAIEWLNRKQYSYIIDILMYPDEKFQKYLYNEAWLRNGNIDDYIILILYK